MDTFTTVMAVIFLSAAAALGAYLESVWRRMRRWQTFLIYLLFAGLWCSAFIWFAILPNGRAIPVERLRPLLKHHVSGSFVDPFASHKEYFGVRSAGRVIFYLYDRSGEETGLSSLIIKRAYCSNAQGNLIIETEPPIFPE